MLERALFLVPLCLIVSLVYAATRSDSLRTIVREGFRFFAVTVGSLVGLAVVLYLICRFLQPSSWL